MDLLKTRLAKFFNRIAERLDYNSVTYIEVPHETIPIKRYDIDKFESVSVVYEVAEKTIEQAKKNGINFIDDVVKYRMANELGHQIMEKHKYNIQPRIVFDGNVPTGNRRFQLSLLVEKPNEN